MNTQSELNGQPSRLRLVRVDGKVMAWSELTGAQIAGALPPSKRAELRVALSEAGFATKPSQIATPAHQRVQSVVNALAHDERCQGKSGLALSLLGNEKLSADEIIAVLAASGVSQGASERDPEAGAREIMRAALREQGNSKIDAIGGNPSPADANPWDQVIANLNRNQGGNA